MANVDNTLLCIHSSLFPSPLHSPFLPPPLLHSPFPSLLPLPFLQVTTALDIAAKAAIEKEYEEYDKTGVISHRLQTHLNLQDKPVGHVDDTSILSGWDGHEEYGEIQWKGIDKSRRMVKQFDKLYDVGQEDQSLDVEEEGRILAEKEKMTLMGEEEEDAGEGKTRLLEAKEERVKLLEEGKEASYGEESREEKTREK